MIEKRHAPSLRKRYISLTVLMGFIVVVAVTFNYLDLLRAKTAITLAHENILSKQADVQEIRTVLLDVYKNIDLFLLDPTNEQLTQQIEEQTERAGQYLQSLAAYHEHVDIQLDKQAETINHLFARLNTETRRLITYRLDINKQYPGMAISANIMEVQQDNVKSGFEILINEIESGDLELQTPEIYPLLLKSYSVWINAISQTRIYMANRLASFTTEILIDQGESLHDMYRIFSSNLEELATLYNGEESFEGPDVLKNMQVITDEWYASFLQMRAISESDEWRTDALLMKKDILPLVHDINHRMDAISRILTQESDRTDDALRRSNERFSNMIFWIIGLFLLFIFAVLFSMEWLVFTPIARVTQALRSRAFEIDLPKIESVNTREVGALIDAFREMDDEISQRQNALEHQAMHDHLTGLPNRFMLHQRIDYQLLSAERQKTSFTLFLMDLDNFKDINDTLGHAAGDELLIEVSRRIQALVRKSDTLSRLGGDEFSILLPDTNRDAASSLADEVINILHQPFTVKDQVVSVGISIGIVSYPEDGEDALALMQYADMAMYSAKRKRIGYSFYDSADDIYSKERLVLFNEVKNALATNVFEVHFQPKYLVENNKLYGAEALLRWHHEDFGQIPADKIVEAAERAGMINQLTLCVLEASISQCARWHRKGFELAVAVNLSVRDLTNLEFCEHVESLLNKYQLSANYLTLEITENIMMENISLSLEVLEGLNRIGVCLSIDDFGTGFSSLAYLKKLPVKELKIDKSFVMDIVDDENDRLIVQSTINLGHNLGLTVVAEGVENEAVLHLISQLGCDQAQGYHLGRPVPASEFETYL